MALLTAEDVLNKAFSKTKYREGFDQDEVDDFLDEVAHTISSLIAERDDLAQRLAQAQSAAPAQEAPEQPAAESPVSAESGLLAAATDPSPPSATGMLAMAQKLHDEYVQAGEEQRDRLIDSAKTKAEQIVEQAETDAKNRMDELVSERSDLERKIDDLRRFERDYRARLKGYLENLLGDLDHGSGAGTGDGLSADHGETHDHASASGDSGATSHDEEPPPAAAPSPWAQARPYGATSGSGDAGTAHEDTPERATPWGASSFAAPEAASDTVSTPHAFGGVGSDDADR